MIEQLLASEKISPDDANLLKNLSNGGYDLAKSQKILEEAALECGSDKNCMADKLAHNPTVKEAFSLSFLQNDKSATAYPGTTTALKAGDLEVLRQLDPEVDNMFLANSYVAADPMNRVKISNDLAAFLATYRDVQGQKELSPAVKAMTQYLATNIFSVTHMNAYDVGKTSKFFNSVDTEAGITDPAQGSLKDLVPGDIHQEVARHYKYIKLDVPSQLAPSQSVSADSGQICTLGDGTIVRQAHCN